MESLPLAEQKFTAALPLVPGVVRTPDGKLNFKGQSENQGLLLVDSTENVDPVTGSFAIPIPIDSIESVSVYSAPDSAVMAAFREDSQELRPNLPFPNGSISFTILSPEFEERAATWPGLQSSHLAFNSAAQSFRMLLTSRRKQNTK